MSAMRAVQLVQWQAPFWQVAPGAHCLVQEPQWVTSVSRTQPSGQSVKPSEQMHVP